VSTDIYQFPHARMGVARAFLRCDRCEQMRSCVQFCAVEHGATVVLNLCVRECFVALVKAVDTSEPLAPFAGIPTPEQGGRDFRDREAWMAACDQLNLKGPYTLSGQPPGREQYVDACGATAALWNGPAQRGVVFELPICPSSR
jgi:hypothetical protein